MAGDALSTTVVARTVADDAVADLPAASLTAAPTQTAYYSPATQARVGVNSHVVDPAERS